MIERGVAFPARSAAPARRFPGKRLHEPPLLRRHDQAFERYANDKSNGTMGRLAQEATVQRVREKVSAYWGVASDDIGFVGNVAEGVSMLMESIAWTAQDNVCFQANEYPSLVAPFAVGGGTKPSRKSAGGEGIQPLVDLIDEHTRIVVISRVSYLNGERFDLRPLRTRCDEVGAMLVVDFTQAGGYLPIDASVADFAFSACYKWMLGVTGAAIAFWNSRRQPRWAPSSAGWYSLSSAARPDYAKGVTLREGGLRFTRGNPAFPSLYILDTALDYLSAYRMADVETYVTSLTKRLIDGVTALDIATTTPSDPERLAASVCIDSPADAEIARQLREAGIFAWAGRGRVRFSFHAYNTDADVERILHVLPAIWSGTRQTGPAAA